MESTSVKRWPFIFLLGSVWGLSECLLGLYLRQCASSISGSVMTAVAIFFLAASSRVSSYRFSLPLMLILASLFKMFDALLLSLPLRHGAVANPIFAFFLETLAFWLVIIFFSQSWLQKPLGQFMAGAFMALTAVNLFPLVKYVTGIPACVVPGTNYPLSLYYAPVAVSLSSLSFPLGLLLGKCLLLLEEKAGSAPAFGWIRQLLAPASLLVGLVILIILRH
jgi:hypothetical protein